MFPGALDGPGGNEGSGDGEVRVEPRHFLAGEREGDEEREEPENEESGEGGASHEGPGSARERQQEREELVGGHDHQVVEPGLHPAAVVVLGLPVVNGAPEAAAEAVEVCPEAGDEGQVQEDGDPRSDQPGPRAPEETREGGDRAGDGEAGRQGSDVTC